jgi:hypothetical protein
MFGFSGKDLTHTEKKKFVTGEQMQQQFDCSWGISLLIKSCVGASESHRERRTLTWNRGGNDTVGDPFGSAAYACVDVLKAVGIPVSGLCAVSLL